MPFRMVACLAIALIALSSMGEQGELMVGKDGASQSDTDVELQWLKLSSRRRGGGGGRSYSGGGRSGGSYSGGSRRRGPSSSSSGGSRRRGPSPSSGGAGDRRRGTPAPDLRRRGVATPLPASNFGNPSARRRAGNADRTDASRRRSYMRRRSSRGWEPADYSRRRGISGSTVVAGAAVGFAGGVVLGTMINRPGGNPYYYHHAGWYDMHHVYHQPGYYSSTGYHYRRASDIGYCPPRSAPDYSANSCGTPWWYYALLGCGCCCCGFGCAYACYMSNSKRESVRVFYGARGRRSSGSSSSSNDMEMTRPQGDPITREGQTIPRADALAFLQALEAEYVDGVEGEVGNMYDRRCFLEEVTQRLDCEEIAVRDAPDRRNAIQHLASRWGMLDSLNSI